MKKQFTFLKFPFNRNSAKLINKSFFAFVFFFSLSITTYSQYCASNSQNCTLEWITNVTFAGINNNSLPSNYTDFTGISGTVIQGSTYAFNGRINQQSGFDHEFVTVWIDWDNNGVFDLNEKYDIGDCNTQGFIISNNITVPLTSSIGTTRMRVSLQWSNPQSDPCAIYQYGEVEDYTIQVLPQADKTWTGAVSTNWNTPGNWSSNSVPLASDNVIINSGYANPPIVNENKATPAVCNNLTINNGVILTISANKALTVNGNITNTGSLIIKSSAVGDGSLLANQPYYGNGSFKVERYLTANKWHLTSAPISNAVSGIFQNIRLRAYNEATNSYGTYITATNIPLTAGVGYSLWSTTNQTRSFIGTLNNGNVGPLSLQLTGAASENTGWNLIGNPYPCAIDWNSPIGWTKNNVGSTIYLWNQSQYATYNGTVGVNGGSNYIASGQGFFVQASGDNATISMNNQIRTHNTISFLKSEDPADIIRVNLNNSEYSDETVIIIRSDATDNFNFVYDAAKLKGISEAPQMYTSKDDGSETSICSYSNIDKVSGKYLSIEPASFVEHAIVYSHTIQSGQCPLLVDLVTQTTIYPNVPYTFTPSENDPINRFQFINASSTSISQQNVQSIMVWENDNKLHVDHLGEEKLMEVKVFDMQGRLVFQGNQSISNLNHLTTATYVVKVATDAQTIVKKIMIK